MVLQIYLNGALKKLKEFMVKHYKVESPNTRIHVYYQPVGVVAALVPWNFPVTLASRKISTALSAGCSVIVKPDVITPGSVMELVDICNEGRTSSWCY